MWSLLSTVLYTVLLVILRCLALTLVSAKNKVSKLTQLPSSINLYMWKPSIDRKYVFSQRRIDYFSLDNFFLY